jgi:sulfur carrier protein ThiS
MDHGSGNYPLCDPFWDMFYGILMRITVFLHTTLQRQARKKTAGEFTIDLPAGSTLNNLLNQLDFYVDIENILVVVNGRNVEMSHQLLEGDQVHLIPAISGGE